MMIRIALLIILSGCACPVPADASEYAVALSPAPVLNTPDFRAVFGGASGHDLKVDRCGQVRELEFIALPGSVFTVLKKQRSGTVDIYQVETAEYAAPPNVRLYVDSRFLEMRHSSPAPRRPSLPSRDEIVSSLKASVGSRYVWGGNVMNGVPELAGFYNGSGADDTGRIRLAGLDCSGLLYHATGGGTPRNTSELLAFGQGVAIAGKQSAEIAAMLQPLDLIVWNGHVVIVLDRETAIESRLACGSPDSAGVVMTQLPRRIAEIMRTRLPANLWPDGKKHQDLFVVRRWYGR